MIKKIIQVEQIGEYSDYFRTYYKQIDKDFYFCKVDFKNNVEWFTCYRNGGEPQYKLGNDVEFEICK
jgi:hypothetical protein